MKIGFLVAFLLCLFSFLDGKPQCTTLGQTPATAFPVCGTDTFSQSTVPICTNKTINSFCNDQAVYQDTNPFWYQFTCFKTGTLGFLITPNDLTDDYDWVLFDITNHQPNDVYIGTSLIVNYNWSGNTSLESARGYTGITGAAPGGSGDKICATNPQEGGGPPPYSNATTINQMPTIIQGHIYLLMVSHYTQSQSGYKLSFGGGSAVITDPGLPAIKNTSIVCGQSQIKIQFSKNIKCSSLAADGSDFVISPSGASIISAYGVNCQNGFDMTEAILTLSNPLPNGNYTVYAQIGTDGNTLLDDCNNEMLVGDSANFISKEAVSAKFGYQVLWGCKNDTIQYEHPGGNGINSWQWSFDSVLKSNLQNPVVIYPVFGEKTTSLMVSNGVCSDTAQSIINLDNTLTAKFTAPDHICPEDKVVFQDSSIGKIINWYWDFGDGTISKDSTPPKHVYPPSQRDVKYTVRLVVQNNLGCYDTAEKMVTRVQSCYITVPSGFTPNGDGVNDFLYPLNAYKATNLDFRVYNRYGQLVFETRDWTRKWDGTINGKPQATNTYVWMLEYTDSDTGKKYFLKGTTVLIR